MRRLTVVPIRRASVFFICSIILLFADCGNAMSRLQPLDGAVAGVVSAFESGDAARLNRFVHPKQGVIVIYREGVFNVFRAVSGIDFKKPVPEYFPYPKIRGGAPLRYAALPVYDCGREAWSKTGLFCDPKYRDALLSTTAINLKKNGLREISPEMIARFRALEAKSIRVVLVDAAGNDLVFYMTKIDSRWYLTILDRVSSDCSA
ncbi:hypothetical protein NY406_07410 [Chlorobaculum sp. MV4-Y]|uniref:hypothetical protein n=1 Tax=Chlorobaculum sp. MV4-Y TaxID=2976335 RepID=UPI0021B05187|nr:hypothetical protein [Chlorobaculum sp. MV4-Y]UWX57052.1 hypothetical protein NY406_07410 [Chlorobaculum sp. MV4-Y]